MKNSTYGISNQLLHPVHLKPLIKFGKGNLKERFKERITHTYKPQIEFAIAWEDIKFASNAEELLLKYFAEHVTEVHQVSGKPKEDFIFDDDIAKFIAALKKANIEYLICPDAYKFKAFQDILYSNRRLPLSCLFDDIDPRLEYQFSERGVLYNKNGYIKKLDCEGRFQLNLKGSKQQKRIISEKAFIKKIETFLEK